MTGFSKLSSQIWSLFIEGTAASVQMAGGKHKNGRQMAGEKMNFVPDLLSPAAAQLPDDLPKDDVSVGLNER